MLTFLFLNPAASAIDLAMCHGRARVHGICQSYCAKYICHDIRRKFASRSSHDFSSHESVRLTSATSSRSSWATAPVATTSNPDSSTTGWTIKPHTPTVGKSEGACGTVGKDRITRRPCPLPTALNHWRSPMSSVLVIELGGQRSRSWSCTAVQAARKSKPSGLNWAGGCSLHLRGVPPAHGTGTAECVSTFGRIGFFECRQEPGNKIVIHGRQGEVVVNGMKFNNSMPSFPLRRPGHRECSDVSFTIHSEIPDLK
jgi:hypothetical protein